MQASQTALRDIAADNLLLHCAGITAGTEVLFVNEAGKGVDRDVIAFLEARARHHGAKVTSIWPARAASPEDIPADVAAAIEQAPVTIFSHQIGPLLRLRPIPGPGIRVLNYATTPAVLDSEFARIPHGLWVEALGRLVGAISASKRWRVTCPLGTDIAGEFMPPPKAANATGFSLRSFPMDTHSPIASPKANGKVALRWLVTSGTHDLGTEGITLDSTIIGHVVNGRIEKFDGAPGAVEAARTFLEGLGRRYDKDPYLVNSWHAGTNPQACVAFGAAQSLEQWMLLAHANPRILHFHVVGEKIPGEISATVVDATVTFDDRVWWDRGRLVALDDPAYREIAAKWAGGDRAFAQSDLIGV